MSDKLFIKDAEFNCFLGDTGKEKTERQKVFLDIELKGDYSEAVRKDDLGEAVDYLEAHSTVKELVEGKRFILAEAMAGKVAELLLENFEVEEVMVRVKKPNNLYPRDVAYFGAEVIRKR